MEQWKYILIIVILAVAAYKFHNQVVVLEEKLKNCNCENNSTLEGMNGGGPKKESKSKQDSKRSELYTKIDDITQHNLGISARELILGR